MIAALEQLGIQIHPVKYEVAEHRAVARAVDEKAPFAVEIIGSMAPGQLILLVVDAAVQLAGERGGCIPAHAAAVDAHLHPGGVGKIDVGLEPVVGGQVGIDVRPVLHRVDALVELQRDGLFMVIIGDRALVGAGHERKRIDVVARIELGRVRHRRLDVAQLRLRRVAVLLRDGRRHAVDPDVGDRPLPGVVERQLDLGRLLKLVCDDRIDNRYALGLRFGRKLDIRLRRHARGHVDVRIVPKVDHRRDVIGAVRVQQRFHEDRVAQRVERQLAVVDVAVGSQIVRVLHGIERVAGVELADGGAHGGARVAHALVDPVAGGVLDHGRVGRKQVLGRAAVYADAPAVISVHPGQRIGVR